MAVAVVADMAREGRSHSGLASLCAVLLLVQSTAAADMAREGRSHSGLANVLQQGDGTTCGQSRYRKLADIVAEKATAPEIDSC